MSVPFRTTKLLAGLAQIRLAELADARAIATIHVDAWRVAYRGIMPDLLLENLDSDEVTNRWIERIRLQATRIYVASASGKVVGWAAFRSLRDSVPVREELLGLYLAPDHWRKGYGTLLYRTGEEDCRDSGGSEISLWVLAKNYGARLFYQKHGYRWSGILRSPKYGSRPCMTLQYWKSLQG
jgi:GNAT superfamily N-acetyltransferase